LYITQTIKSVMSISEIMSIGKIILIIKDNVN
jgi:hypothetical protein